MRGLILWVIVMLLMAGCHNQALDETLAVGPDVEPVDTADAEQPAEEKVLTAAESTITKALILAR